MYTSIMSRPPLSSDEGWEILRRIRKIRPFVQASLTVTRQRCGRPSCRCALQGELHETSLLTWKEKGKTRTLHVPIELRQEVARWVEEGKRLKRLIDEMSEAQKRLLKQKRKKD